MPYIGRNHIAGDHTSNFKLLDDISSYTATFDGSATSVVDTTNNTIRVVEHRFIQGQRVTYTNGGGGNIGGLTTGTAYFVIFDSASTIKLATSASNAASNTTINLSAVGTGSSHTLNAAFDGVNTKFKLTHGSGTGARLNNASQINIAINNVVQRPNLDPNNFTDGFALEDNHKIVFQTAPTNQDIFWGSIIANTLTTFDISDHKIDTFTGDGSTTEFTLSHTPANNESLMVTINGVLQHPSNASTARAYTLIASIIQFTTAPGVGDEIQVRHLGFAGATTADVSGFYGRTGNVVLTANDHITTGNINAGIVTATTFDGAFSSSVGGSNANFTGIVTAGVFKGGDFDGRNLNISGIATFVGDVSIGGTLTYEDVTNIDSVGIITARDGIDCNADLDVDGHTNLDNVSIAGVTTFSDNDIHFKNNGITSCRFDSNRGALEFNHSGGLFWYKNGNLSNSSGATIFYSEFANQYKGLVIQAPWQGQTNAKNVTVMGSSNGRFNVQNNLNASETFSAYFQGGVHLGYYQSGTKLSTTTTGITLNQDLTVNRNALITGISTFTGNIDANGDIDVDGHTNLDNVSIAGVTTFASGNVQLASDSQRLQLGSGQDLWMYHTGTSGGGHGLIQNDYGTMYMLSDSFIFRDRSTNHNVFQISENNSVSLYYQNSAKLSTTSIGAQIDTTLRLYGAAGTGGGRLRLAEGAAYSEIRGVRNTDTSSELWFGTEISDTVDYRAKINTGGHFIPGTDSTYDLGLTGTRWRNVYADTLYGDGSNLTGITQTTINNNANNRLITGSNTANTLDAESALTFYNSGSDPILTISNSGHAQLTLTSTSGTDHCSINFGDSADHDAGEIRYTNSSDSMNFDTAGAARLILDSSGNLYPNTTDSQSLGLSSARWKNLFLGQGGQIQIGDATNTNFIGITEGLVNTYTDQDFISIYFRNSLRFFSNNNNERIRIHSDGDLQLYNGNIVGNSSHTMEIGDITNGAVKRIRMSQGGELHFGDTTTSNFMGITEGTVNQFSDVDNIAIYYRNSLKFFSNNNTQRLVIDTSGNFLPAVDNNVNLGSLSYRWANIYSADLNLSNEGSKNDVDGTWGNYTIQEGQDDLFLINKRNGKKYMFVLKEVS